MSFSWCGAVACAEEFGTFSEDFSIANGLTGKVTLRCNWSDRYTLINAMIGTAWPFAGTTGPQANSIACVPFQSKTVTDGQGLVYEHALVTISYSSEIKDLISETLEPTAEFQIQDFKRFRWGAAAGEPLLEGEAPGKLMRGLNLVRTMHQVTTVPPETLTRVGYVNSAVYTSAILGLSFAVETLLYQPPTLSRTIKTDGATAWTINLKFGYKPQGWNKFFRQKNANVGPDFGWEEIYTTEGEIFKPYQPGSFGVLLV